MQFSSMHDIHQELFTIGNSANCKFHKLFQFYPFSYELWCVTFYGQYTKVFFDMMILLGETVSNLLAAQINFVAGGGRTGLVVRASDSRSGDPGSILGRVGALFP